MVRRRQAIKPGVIESHRFESRVAKRSATAPEEPTYDPVMRRWAGWLLIVLNVLLWAAIVWGVWTLL